MSLKQHESLKKLTELIEENGMLISSVKDIKYIENDNFPPEHSPARKSNAITLTILVPVLLDYEEIGRAMRIVENTL